MVHTDQYTGHPGQVPYRVNIITSCLFHCHESRCDCLTRYSGSSSIDAGIEIMIDPCSIMPCVWPLVIMTNGYLNTLLSMTTIFGLKVAQYGSLPWQQYGYMGPVGKKKWKHVNLATHGGAGLTWTRPPQPMCRTGGYILYWRLWLLLSELFLWLLVPAFFLWLAEWANKSFWEVHS